MNYVWSKLSSRLLVLLVITLFLASFTSLNLVCFVKGTSEYEKYVHNFYNSPPYGNWTFVEKPVFPVYLNESQVSVGSNWTVVCPLKANHSYHIYCYGEWIDYGPNPQTDYDVYVYNPSGVLESYHTEAPGFPENLGSTVDDPYFTPRYSGNYSFVIRNDPRESKGEQSATFMIIENLECNRWHEIFIQGKENSIPVLNTSWAFEFVTDSRHVEVDVRVPDTLDMYEARLYMMANPEAEIGESLNDVPLAWEPGLYGEIEPPYYGGYNLESKEFRGLAYASCEFHGQDMQINYTSQVDGRTLYHLVLIGEEGYGDLSIAVKTRFEFPNLLLVSPQGRVYAEANSTQIIFEAENFVLEEAKLCYTTNEWQNTSEIDMNLANGTCIADIPTQMAGTIVQYKVEATDTLKNPISVAGNFSVKHYSETNLTLNKKLLFPSEQMNVSGSFIPAIENLTLSLLFISENETIHRTTIVEGGGNWSYTFNTDIIGNWSVKAEFEESDLIFSAETQVETFIVDETKSYQNREPYGNWTFIEKPMVPVVIEESQITIGSNWTMLCYLTANRKYHIYFYGEWVESELSSKTDYDIYVYDPFGGLEGYHTQSAELQEHLGISVTSPNEPFFIPKQTGNYSFVIRNDPRESQASQGGTFIIIENKESNEWHEVYLQGKIGDLHVEKTSWAFEFVSNDSHVEVWIRIPYTLDMYEARLYMMANPEAEIGSLLKEVPIAWESGLYGEVDDEGFGGYSLYSAGDRGFARASCEYFGQDMLINCTSPFPGETLWHLVFIGEQGSGMVDFLIKTEFVKPLLIPVDPPLRAYPQNETSLLFISDSTELRNSTLYYSVDGWESSEVIEMEIFDNRTCQTVIPGQPAGTTVQYRVLAMDILLNSLVYNGSYPVKYPVKMNLTIEEDSISIGRNVSLAGFLKPTFQNLSINIIFTSANGTFTQTVFTSANGTFKSSFKPETEGNWVVQAIFEGDNLVFKNSSRILQFNVGPPSFFSRYSTFIFAGAGIGIVGISIFYVKKRRE